MSNKHYVYELIDPFTEKPFYVGKGTGNRHRFHFSDAKRPKERQTNKLKCERISQILENGNEVIVNIVANDLTSEAACELETKTICKYRAAGIDLTNLMGRSGSNEAKIKRPKGTPVHQYDINGNFITTYASSAIAAETVGVAKSTICAVLNGRSQTAAGYRWRYDKELLKPLITTSIPVDQYTLNGTLIGSYNSITAAAEALNCHFSTIVECLNGSKGKTAAGYRWVKSGELLPTEQIKIPPVAKAYECYTKEGIFVNRFHTVAEACRATGANATGIVDCCAGRKKSSGGYIWKSIILPEFDAPGPDHDSKRDRL